MANSKLLKEAIADAKAEEKLQSHKIALEKHLLLNYNLSYLKNFKQK